MATRPNTNPFRCRKSVVLVAMLLMSSVTSAAQVFTCEAENLSIVSGAPHCTDWIITEYSDMSNLVQILDDLIGFDPVVFAGVELLLITTFFTAFTVGKVARILGRT